MPAGANITLRRVEPTDYPDILRWQNDPEIFRWMDYEAPFSLDDIRRSEERARAEGLPFIIEFERKAIGRAGLNNFRRRDRIASMYMFVGERGGWGRGLASDALTTLLRFAFESLDLRLVELWTLADNERALRLYKSVGFTEDARLPERSFKEGTYVDHVVMSIDREAFERATER